MTQVPINARSQRALPLAQSEIRAMTRQCHRLNGINLGQGLCDLPTLPLVKDAAIEAIKNQRSTYSYPEGAPELRQAIAAKLERDNHIAADPDSQIVVTVGATGAFTSVVHALLDPGDGILVFEPYYGYHVNAAKLAGLKPQFVTLRPPEFEVTAQAIEAAVTVDTKAIVVCTPANPSGKMWNETELNAVAQVAERHNLLVITDEIYEYIRFEGRPHISPASLPALADRTVTIMGLSKTFSITGWRLGYAVAPADLAEAITIVNDIYYVCAPTPLQLGAAAGFSAPESFFSGLASSYENKRDIICRALGEAKLPPIVPQGAYYVLADVSRLGAADSKAAAMTILERVGVASIPGKAFFRGDAGEHLVRFCFAKEEDVLKEAAAQLTKL